MTAFRVTATSNQSISSAGTEIAFDSVRFDQDGVFASNRFTVPLGWDQRIGQLFAGYRTTTLQSNVSCEIQRSTDGGTVWDAVSYTHGGVSTTSMTTASPPIVFAVGDIYRFVVFSNGTTSAGSPGAVNFSGCMLPTETDEIVESKFAQVSRTVNQAIAGGAFDVVEWDNVDFDADGLFNGGTFTFDVPAIGWDPMYAIVSALGGYSLFGQWLTSIQVSYDGGVTFADIDQAQDAGGDQIGGSAAHCGVLKLVNGVKIQVKIFNGESAQNIVAGTGTHFNIFAWRTTTSPPPLVKNATLLLTGSSTANSVQPTVNFTQTGMHAVFIGCDFSTTNTADTFKITSVGSFDFTTYPSSISDLRTGVAWAVVNVTATGNAVIGNTFVGFTGGIAWGVYKIPDVTDISAGEQTELRVSRESTVDLNVAADDIILALGLWRDPGDITQTGLRDTDQPTTIYNNPYNFALFSDVFSGLATLPLTWTGTGTTTSYGVMGALRVQALPLFLSVRVADTKMVHGGSATDPSVLAVPTFVVHGNLSYGPSVRKQTTFVILE